MKIFGLGMFMMMLGLGVGNAWVYPVQEVEGKFCGQQVSLCKIELPKIKNADYLSYQRNGLYRSIYTVLRGGTYFGGRDFGLGAHKGVDIASTMGTAIYAIGSGEVILAETRGDRGKVITIKHWFAGRVIYSNYAHLEEILVSVGDQVAEGQLIAKMGSSGNSTGPHLHFQIDTNEGKHPYHPGGCGGESLMQNVNEARCWKQIQQNTLDPILFLETQGKIFEAEHTVLQDQDSSYFLMKDELGIELEQQIVKLGRMRKLVLRNLRPSQQGFLKEMVRIEGGGGLEIVPEQIMFLGGEREVMLQAKTAGLYLLKVRYGQELIKQVPIFVLDEEMIARLQARAVYSPQLKLILQELER